MNIKEEMSLKEIDTSRKSMNQSQLSQVKEANSKS